MGGSKAIKAVGVTLSVEDTTVSVGVEEAVALALIRAIVCFRGTELDRF